MSKMKSVRGLVCSGYRVFWMDIVQDGSFSDSIREHVGLACQVTNFRIKDRIGERIIWEKIGRSLRR